MDCQTALEILESVRPDSDDWNEPEVAAAAEFLKNNPECDAVFRSRQVLDRQVGQAMRNVEVPPEAQERLLGIIRQEGVSSSENDSTENNPVVRSDSGATTPAQQSSRRFLSRRARQMLAVVAAVAICLTIGGLFWQLYRSPGPVYPMHALREMAASVNPEQLAAFDRSFAAQLPSGGWQLGRLALRRPPKGIRPPGASQDVMALYTFPLRLSDGAVVGGMLAVVPQSGVAEPPSATYFDTTQVRYVTSKRGRWATIAWKEEGRVYLALVPAKVDALDSLKESLQIAPA